MTDPESVVLPLDDPPFQVRSAEYGARNEKPKTHDDAPRTQEDLITKSIVILITFDINLGKVEKG